MQNIAAIPSRFSSLFFTFILLFIASGLGTPPPAMGQGVSGLDRDRGLNMLRVIKDDIKKNYYDPTFHGLDLDARFHQAEEHIKTADSLGQVWGIIAQAVVDLNDSHTIFHPPARSNRYEYGWLMQTIGDKCLVTAIKPGSDAAAKALREGDEIISVAGLRPNRANLWKLKYMFYSLRPQAALVVEVRNPSGEVRRLDIQTKIRQGKVLLDITDPNELMNLIREAESESRLNAHRYYDSEATGTLIWKMPEFDLPPTKVDELMNRATKRQALILDLRGNPGGSEETLLRLIGNLFDHDVRVGEIARRKETKPYVAKTRGGERVFKGRLIVLVDSGSASSAEVLARVVQLEKRGVVIGDLTAGAVMRARTFSHQIGADTVVFYGASVTDADLIMADGQSLERRGVTPDELLLPTEADLAGERDPVLARAAALAGFTLDAARAGKLFPVEWKK